MSCHRLVAALVAALALSAPAPLSAEDEARTWYAQAVTRDARGLRVTDLWANGPALRSETVRRGHRIVTIVSGEWYHVYDVMEGSGIAIRRDPGAVAEDGRRGRPFAREYDALVEAGAELVKQDDSLGFSSGVYRITDDRGKRELRVTLDEERLPLRFEVFDRASGSRSTTDYVAWQKEVTLGAAFFQPPKEIRFERMELAAYLQARGESAPRLPVLHGSLLTPRRK